MQLFVFLHLARLQVPSPQPKESVEIQGFPHFLSLFGPKTDPKATFSESAPFVAIFTRFSERPNCTSSPIRQNYLFTSLSCSCFFLAAPERLRRLKSSLSLGTSSWRSQHIDTFRFTHARTRICARILFSFKYLLAI